MIETMSVLLQRARSSGQCPPSLLFSEERVMNSDSDSFDADLLKLMEPSGFSLRSDSGISKDFLLVLKKAESVDRLPASIKPELRSQILECRRCVILAVVAGTSEGSPCLPKIMDGYLTAVKSWLDDTLAKTRVDLLLHLLSKIVNLPVTKAVIKDSGLGKAVGAVEKHRICKGTPNENAIVQRVQQIKEAWHKRVKAQKVQEATKETGGSKRPPESASLLQNPTKKAKTMASIDDTKKASSFSNLLKKVTTAPPSSSSSLKAIPDGKSPTDAAVVNGTGDSDVKNLANKKEKKSSRRVKWADHFGGKITVTQDEDVDESETKQKTDAAVSWSDRKKRDRLREKELLSKAKKSKLMDDTDDDGLDLLKVMKPATAWRMPSLLPDRSDVTQPQLVSSEVHTQTERVKSVTPSNYVSDSDVPDSPSPLSDSEQALDMTSQGSAVISTIPFFVPQAASSPTPATVSTTYPETTQTYSSTGTYLATPQFDTIATAEFVQSLGLPMFLVGQSKNALQTLASSPSLLSTLVDANGMYDQPRLMNLVQTLSASAGGIQPQSVAAPSPYLPALPSNTTTAPGINTAYGLQSAYQPTSKPVISKSVEGNLHVSGYGAGTTEADLIASFSPYVKVDEVVMKGTFAFINTSDPAAAGRAKEALTGTLIGGMPVRINQATRKSQTTVTTAAAVPSYGVVSAASVRSNSLSSFGTAPTPAPMAITPTMAPLPPITGTMPPNGMPDVDSVRDDRGNPATKNLFIAGYGPSTTEQQLRDVVSQYVFVVGVILKGTFSFVNTVDRASAVYAREMLSGTMLNGGVIRINFAKETGRLGTSFDLTYGPNTGPNASRSTNARPPPTTTSYYGRGGGY